MKIGLAYDLKQSVTAVPAAPVDALEEYDSADTVNLLAAAIEEAGHRPVKLGGGREFLDNVLTNPVDFVFNISEGRGAYRSREAQVPSVLEMLGIPYSGADPQTLAIALDKPLTKQIVQLAGVTTPQWRFFNKPEEARRADWHDFRFPAFVKPAFEGSSKGIRLTSTAANPNEVIAHVRQLYEGYGQPVIVEEFIDGDEVTCGIIGNVTANGPQPLVLPMRIILRQKKGPFIYSLEVKRDYKKLVDYEFPAQLPESIIDRIKSQALTVFTTLGCRDFTRMDFRIAADGTPYFLEVNPLPGLSLDSDLFIITTSMGWSHSRLIVTILENALSRYPSLCK
ncbi:D-alanine--D-alanine ligase family protein [Dehalogenimonas etheniformans]|uniref:D-alanine--D-alanine ligase n=1 Tax=Dehalogenimonas etheniformans TaxID=1536648 RepID=A0A2P5P920_9CHLR|nr:ATP-grasp domain-containing protein [Dehalogenimonas etheniformans]PPD58793.1 D-alanine--D-alanine ligase [Dehalogenimonas etheniformans]QNT76437.1 ATP-grasp domain-containing protein [Dehalogenimonas etheniformans]